MGSESENEMGSHRAGRHAPGILQTFFLLVDKSTTTNSNKVLFGSSLQSIFS